MLSNVICRPDPSALASRSGLSLWLTLLLVLAATSSAFAQPEESTWGRIKGTYGNGNSVSGPRQLVIEPGLGQATAELALGRVQDLHPVAYASAELRRVTTETGPAIHIVGELADGNHAAWVLHPVTHLPLAGLLATPHKVVDLVTGRVLLRGDIDALLAGGIDFGRILQNMYNYSCGLLGGTVFTACIALTTPVMPLTFVGCGVLAATTVALCLELPHIIEASPVEGPDAGSNTCVGCKP